MTAQTRPLCSMLLLAYQQQGCIAQAIDGALAQTYSPLEIVISDDASDDATWAVIQRRVAGYAGPHRLVLNRNASNLGIGAHISRALALSHGELLFVAAGDDVSLPQRCDRVVDAWLAAGRKPDLIASCLNDMDADGLTHGVIRPTNLAGYRHGGDWLARPPFVVGAAQAWTRRVFDRFGPLPAGVVGEDLLMVFRAVCSGGAITLPEALVNYRRGGVSRRERALTAADVTRRLLNSNRAALVELPQLLADARVAGQVDAVGPALRQRLARAQFTERIFAAPGAFAAAQVALAGTGVPAALRLRLLVYAAAPGLLAPFFALKRRLARGR